MGGLDQPEDVQVMLLNYASDEHGLGVTLKLLGRFQSAAHHYRRSKHTSSFYIFFLHAHIMEGWGG